MNRRIATVLFAVATLVACHRKNDVKHGQQQNYDIVQEGSASGASSTINAPGETLPPATNTSIDTTTSFTLSGAQTATSTAPLGSIGSTLPPADGSVSMPSAPPSAAPQPRAPRPVQQTVRPQQQEPYSAPSVATPPPATTTTAEQTQPTRPPESEEPPPTDTTSTTSTASTTTTETAPPPPPPTTTDTRGW